MARALVNRRLAQEIPGERDAILLDVRGNQRRGATGTGAGLRLFDCGVALDEIDGSPNMDPVGRLVELGCKLTMNFERRLRDFCPRP